MPETKPVRFGIVGCGTASIPVCDAIAASPITELAAVYDVNPDMARDIGHRFQVSVMDTLNDLLNNSTVDAAYIAVPHYLLARPTGIGSWQQALTETPAISWKQVDALMALAHTSIDLGFFYEMRYAPRLHSH